jgi:hypothetical protein
VGEIYRRIREINREAKIGVKVDERRMGKELI